MDLDHLQAIVLDVLAVLTLVMPYLEKWAKATKNTVDDEVVSTLEKILSMVPRVRLGDKK